MSESSEESAIDGNREIRIQDPKGKRILSADVGNGEHTHISSEREEGKQKKKKKMASASVSRVLEAVKTELARQTGRKGYFLTNGGLWPKMRAGLGPTEC